ncbi:MAG: hypothetical protein ISQ56_02850 [Pseudomonadales bacterium]|nr:hypothetical protein [Pseudomonadales bacterium]
MDIVIEIGVTNLGDFALAACLASRAATLGLFAETHLTEKIAGVQLGDDDFFTVASSRTTETDPLMM